tara:strand:- start:22181 stop:22399 length:219 start_codon:yes stop_codon:yes gene_type:complete
VSIEEDSIAFLEKQMDENFSEIFEQYVVEDIVWDDFGMSGQRAYCYFVHPYPPDGKSNIIALLPPFYPNSAK